MPTQTSALLDHDNAERILEEGWKMFQHKGYRGVSIDALCAQCGLSKPTLYYYFGDKENLFVQVLARKLHGFRQVIEQPGPLAVRLQRTAATILESFETEYSSLLRDRTHIKDPGNLEKIREAFHSELFGPLAAVMQDGSAAGELRDDKPEVLTLVFLGVLNNFIGKAAELKVTNEALAGRLTAYFLLGAASAAASSAPATAEADKTNPRGAR